MVRPYFGHCASFTCYKIERGIIVECQNMPNPHQSPARIAAVLRELDVTAVITGIIERDAVEALEAADIEVVANQEGSARDAAEAYLAHTLIGADEWHKRVRPQRLSKRVAHPFCWTKARLRCGAFSGIVESGFADPPQNGRLAGPSS